MVCIKEFSISNEVWEFLLGVNLKGRGLDVCEGCIH